MTVPQLPVRSHFTTRRVSKGNYSIGLIVLPLFLFIFSGILYVLQKKINSLFTLYRWLFRLWYESKDLKWWHAFLCQGVCNLYISWYTTDLCNLFSLDHFSQNSHLYAKSLVQNLGWGMYRIIETGIVCFVEDFDVITIVFQLQYLQ